MDIKIIGERAFNNGAELKGVFDIEEDVVFRDLKEKYPDLVLKK